MMHSDSRVKEPVCLATTSLPDPCLSTYLSPRFREEPFLWLCPRYALMDLVRDLRSLLQADEWNLGGLL